MLSADCIALCVLTGAATSTVWSENKVQQFSVIIVSTLSHLRQVLLPAVLPAHRWDTYLCYYLLIGEIPVVLPAYWRDVYLCYCLLYYLLIGETLTCAITCSLVRHLPVLWLGMWQISNQNPTESNTFFEICWIIKIQSCRIQIFSFGPTLQSFSMQLSSGIWRTAHCGLMLVLLLLSCYLYFLENSHNDFNYSLLVCL